MTPKILHFIWVGGSHCPEQFLAWRKAWADLHPSWSVRAWDDANIPVLRNTFEYHVTPVPACKADILRLEILHLYGGVYIDSDTEPLRAIDPLLDDPRAFVASETEPGGRADPVNGIMGFPAGHPALVRAIEALPRRFSGKGTIAQRTGPGLIGAAIEGDQTVRVLPPEAFCPLPWWSNGPALPTDDSYAIHRYALSWRKIA